VLLFAALSVAGQSFTALHAASLAYFLLLTLALHAWQEPDLDTDPKGFVRRFMLGLFLKMMVSLLVLVAMVFFIPAAQSIPLALSFALLYVAYLAFSTVRMSQLLRKSPRP
jgi:hypothetical protein